MKRAEPVGRDGRSLARKAAPTRAAWLRVAAVGSTGNIVTAHPRCESPRTRGANRRAPEVRIAAHRRCDIAAHRRCDIAAHPRCDIAADLWAAVPKSHVDGWDQRWGRREAATIRDPVEDETFRRGNS